MKTPHDLKGSQRELDPTETATDSNRAAPSLDDLLARAVADKLEGQPALLQIPLENIDRWLTRGAVSNSDAFRRWRDLLERARVTEGGFQRVLEILRSDSEEARRWRDFSPFAGVLSATERRAVIRRCNYSH